MGPESGPGRFDPTDFSTFVISLGTNVLLHLGQTPDGVALEEPVKPDLQLAEQTIGILAMLEEKTRGNLDRDEEGLLRGILYQSRIAFLKARDEGG